MNYCSSSRERPREQPKRRARKIKGREGEIERLRGVQGNRHAQLEEKGGSFGDLEGKQGRRALRLAVRKERQLRAGIMEKEFASSGKQK